MDTFIETGLRKEIISAISELGFETPTPIQAESIPHILTSDQDLIALAQTGTGKTAAFGLPAIHRIDTTKKEPQTIVLCPTRELCLQITRDLESYAKKIKGLKILAVYGGSSIDTQIRALKKGVQIVVGTPGRTRDLIKRKRLSLGSIERVILDEADEMLTMGFKEELDAILETTPEEKQTLLFSATISKEVKRISKKYMNDPLEIAVAKENVGATNVEHVYYMVQARHRYEVLKRIADMNPNLYAIVFCRTRRETMEVSNKLMADGYNADVLNGDLSQAQRDEVMGKFRTKHLQVLVATDVAARGIDVNDLTHVINYNLPDDPEVYTHRSGRTGRAGRDGISIVIIHSREANRIRFIERQSSIKFTREQVPSGRDICETQLFTLIDRVKKVKVDEQQIEPFLPEVYEKLQDLSREDLIQHFVSAEFNRFLDYYKNARDINIYGRGDDRDDRRDRRGGRRDRDGRRGDRRRDSRDERAPRDRREKRSKSERRKSSYTRLHINVGSKNKLTPARLIGVINEGLDSSSAGIGKIEILKKFSFFEIEQGMEKQLMDSLKGESFEGVDLALEMADNKKSPVPKDYSKKKKSKKKDKDRDEDWKKKGPKNRGKRRKRN